MSDLRIPRFDALTLNHRDSMVRKAHYEGCVMQDACHIRTS